jgi:hypothetical protein
MTRIQTKTAEIWMDGEGIVRIKVLEGAQIDVDDLKDRLKIIKKLTDGKRALVLSDGTAFYHISKEAATFLAGKETAEAFIAMALFATSLANKLIANFFINFNRPLVPVMVFNEEKEALKWLRSFSSIASNYSK